MLLFRTEIELGGALSCLTSYREVQRMETGGAVYCIVRGSWFGTSWMGALVVGAASNKSPISELHFLFCETNRIYQDELFEI